MIPLLPPLAPLRVIDDYGAIGQGASQAHYVLAENGQEYIIKGPALTPNHPYVAANEFIAARLAQYLTVPVLDSRIVEMNGNLFWAGAWMTKNSFYPAIDASLFAQCTNRDRIYSLVVLDAWICNQDRHSQNLLARRVGKAQQHIVMVANDHSHCLILPSESPTMLQNRLNSDPHNYVKLDFVSEALQDIAELDNALRTAENVSDAAIQAVVGLIPGPLLHPRDQGIVADFLTQRRGLLRTVFRNGRGAFAQLGAWPKSPCI